MLGMSMSPVGLPRYLDTRTPPALQGRWAC